MRDALHAEWTKLRTVAGTGWLLFALVTLTVAVSAAAAHAVTCPMAGCGLDPAKVSLTGVEFGQAIVAVLAVLAISGEYGTGMIRVTFAAMPTRGAVLAAKSIVLSGLIAAAGCVAVPMSLMFGRFLLLGNGFTAAHGYRTLSLTDGPVLRAAVGSVCYLVLIGLLALGIATAVRDSAAAIGLVLGLLYLFPIVAALVRGQEWGRHLDQISPMTAGLAVQATVDVGSQSIAPWPGLGVLAAWAAAALFAGALLLRMRDT